MRHQPIDSTLHGLTDYTVGATLLAAFPRLAGIAGTPAGRQIRTAGALHAGYSTLTRYPLGIARVIPYKVHLALDAAGALALAAAPFVTGGWRQGPRQWVPNVALALFELSAVALSDPSGDGSTHGDVAAVRAANRLDPQRVIGDTRPAVRPEAVRPA